MNTSPGTYVTAGNQLMALVDTSSFWIAGDFKETQLPHIQVGQKARITLMGHEGQPFQAVVRSVGWGIFVADGAGSTSTALLPAVDQTIDWVRLPQRFPVRLQVAGPTPMPLRIGQTVSVAIIPEFEPVDAPEAAVSCWTVMSAVATHAVSFAWRWPWAGRPSVTYGYATGSRWAWRRVGFVLHAAVALAERQLGDTYGFVRRARSSWARSPLKPSCG